MSVCGSDTDDWQDWNPDAVSRSESDSDNQGVTNTREESSITVMVEVPTQKFDKHDPDQTDARDRRLEFDTHGSTPRVVIVAHLHLAAGLTPVRAAAGANATTQDTDRETLGLSYQMRVEMVMCNHLGQFSRDENPAVMTHVFTQQGQEFSSLSPTCASTMGPMAWSMLVGTFPASSRDLWSCPTVALSKTMWCYLKIVFSQLGGLEHTYVRGLVESFLKLNPSFQTSN